jgi:ArsR family transcriptional regulator
VDAGFAQNARWELYRLLGEKVRLRLLTLCGEDELSVGELAELLGESQPNVSKHVAALRRAGLLSVRKQGTRVFVRLAEGAAADAVVADAARAGRVLCEGDGSLARVAQVVRARDAASRELFARGDAELAPKELPPELPAYLSALAPLVADRGLAVDVGTGDGRLLDVLAPVFERVVALDRSPARLARAGERMRERGYGHVELIEGDVDDAGVRRRVKKLGGADAVFASRILHHAPRPKQMLGALAELARSPSGDRAGGAVVVLDYEAHEDEKLREAQADLWLGFDARELLEMSREAGLAHAVVRPLPAGVRGEGPDAHVGWHVLIARRASESKQ